MKDQILSENNLVMGVNQPGNAYFTTYVVENGDTITMTQYKPTKTQNPLVPAGNTYNCVMLTKEDGTQAFLQWSPNNPAWQTLMNSLPNMKVRGIGAFGDNTLQEGDHFTMRGGGNPLGMTWDVFRGNKAVATFSCLIPGNPPMPK